MHLLDDLLRSISDSLALSVAAFIAVWHWLAGDMSPAATLSALGAFVLAMVKAWEVRQRRRDVAFLREAFEEAELNGDNRAREAAAALMRDRMDSRRGGL